LPVPLMPVRLRRSPDPDPQPEPRPRRPGSRDASGSGVLPPAHLIQTLSRRRARPAEGSMTAARRGCP